jgi:hypothetical protein
VFSSFSQRQPRRRPWWQEKENSHQAEESSSGKSLLYVVAVDGLAVLLHQSGAIDLMNTERYV